jgi:hypothetical protein
MAIASPEDCPTPQIIFVHHTTDFFEITNPTKQPFEMLTCQSFTKPSMRSCGCHRDIATFVTPARERPWGHPDKGRHPSSPCANSLGKLHVLPLCPVPGATCECPTPERLQSLRQVDAWTVRRRNARLTTASCAPANTRQHGMFPRSPSAPRKPDTEMISTTPPSPSAVSRHPKDL